MRYQQQFSFFDAARVPSAVRFVNLSKEAVSEDLDGATVEADLRDAAAEHAPDRMPIPEEEEAAPEEASPEAAKAYEEALERGANVKGEGQVDS